MRSGQRACAGKSPFSWAARLQELGSHAQDFDDDSRQVCLSSWNEIWDKGVSSVCAGPSASACCRLSATSCLIQCRSTPCLNTSSCKFTSI